MNVEQRRAISDELYRAFSQQHCVRPLTERDIEITVDDAYYISLQMLERRLKDDGEKVIGKKIGVTSKVVQEMLGVPQPDFGFLTSNMFYADGASIPIAENLIQPRAEGEIAFKLKSDLIGPSVTEEDVLNATEYVTPCFEIVDSRIEDWKIKIEDTVADNASCGVFVLGKEKVDPNTIDLCTVEMKVYKNDQFLSKGVGAAVLGNPLTAVAWLANTLSQYGIPLNAGEIILSGSLVPLENVRAGDKMSLTITGIGSASCQFV